ncbi:SDR family oxidoreductase [Streptomyces sp. NBC_00654]|uniref:SDR family oxidoreductase n=1 Tax=Streptomyces sp. NBC_00654 TaxID=2975799 RepID=UPI0022553FD0|nr:SDR family oxidoreductase [Streptomyces sp. NBC_00654]MCX4966986.1 SDR family oxidoreductase [Streptomyces sp. NBC_00654]
MERHLDRDSRPMAGEGCRAGREPVAVVTGGACGIGRAVVADLAAHGYQVTVLDRDVPADRGDDRVRWVAGDVRDPGAHDRAVDAALARCGRLDLFVGNAGVHDGGFGVRDLSGAALAELARHVLDVDVVGYLLGARAAAGALADSRGSMVFTLSDASYLVGGNGTGIVYAAAKHAALGVVRHLAADLAPSVRVNAVAPGGIVTGLRTADGRHVFAEADEITAAVREFNPLGVVLSAEQVAPLYRFLASPEAAGMTGEVLRPDGGLTVR